MRKRLLDALCWIGIFLCAGFCVAALSYPAWAHDPSSPNASWYNNAELTPSAQKRLKFLKCCSNDDVVHTKFKVDKTTGTDEWYYLKGDKWENIPADIIHWGVSAPDGQPTLFALNHAMLGHPAGTLTCFFPGQGGT